MGTVDDEFGRSVVGEPSVVVGATVGQFSHMKWCNSSCVDYSDGSESDKEELGEHG
jgi:hypothetical protein